MSDADDAMVERLMRERDEARAQVATAREEGRRAGLEEAAKVVDSASRCAANVCGHVACDENRIFLKRIRFLATTPATEPAAPTPPPDWYTHHLTTCGTAFRGCDPKCPKDVYEKTGSWEP